MRRLKSIILLTLVALMFGLVSCRFAKPLTSKLIKADTIQIDTLEISLTYHYLNISRFGFKGLYKITKKIIDDSKIVYVEYERRSTYDQIRDGHQLYRWKRLKYHDDRIYEKTIRVNKSRGLRPGKLKRCKTFLYDNKGHSIKKTNDKQNILNKD